MNKYVIEFLAIGAFAMATFGMTQNAQIVLILFYARKTILHFIKIKLVQNQG